jgi:hypothetical protein
VSRRPLVRALAVLAVAATLHQPSAADDGGQRLHLVGRPDCSGGSLAPEPVEGHCPPGTVVAVAVDGPSSAVLGPTTGPVSYAGAPVGGPVRWQAGQVVQGQTAHQAPEPLPAGRGRLRVQVLLSGRTSDGETVEVGADARDVDLQRIVGPGQVIAVPFRLAVPTALHDVALTDLVLRVAVSGTHVRTTGLRHGTHSWVDLPA